MPAESVAQQHYMGAAYARKKAGRPDPGDPKMSLQQFKDFAGTKLRGLPQRVAPRRMGR